MGIDCLREVNQCHSLVPIEDIVPREVAMNATVVQSKLDVAHDTVKERLRFLIFKQNIAEPRGWFTYIPDIFHQYGITDLRKSARHIGTMGVEQTLSLVLVIDPGCYLGCAPFLVLSCCSTAPTAVTVLPLTLFITLSP